MFPEKARYPRDDLRKPGVTKDAAADPPGRVVRCAGSRVGSTLRGMSSTDGAAALLAHAEGSIS